MSADPHDLSAELTAAITQEEGELEMLRCRAAGLLVDELAGEIDDAGPALREVRRQRLALEARIEQLRAVLASRARRAA